VHPLIWPLLLVLAIGVKFSSPGLVIFKQRRYGLDGHGILVYKFRSMRVCEDGATINQAAAAIPVSPDSAPSSAAPRWTSCPSSSTFCRAA
jgi:lipopolysaccharide/colanic/teichoic acid biosynthesis glycosyltransferase